MKDNVDIFRSLCQMMKARKEFEIGRSDQSYGMLGPTLGWLDNHSEVCIILKQYVN